MLRQGLMVHTIGRRLVYYHVLPSSMDEAAHMAEEGVEEGTVVTAEEQTAGRGRFGRSWVSPGGNLLLSILLRPSLYSLRYLSIMAGVATARAIASASGLEATLKWPNDVRVAGKKVGGILVESSLEGNSVRHAVIGIGINVDLDPAQTEALAAIATCLNREAGRPVARERLLRDLLQEADSLYHSVQKGSPPLEEWRSLVDTLGRRVKVQVRHAGPRGGRGKLEVYSGVAEDVDLAGNLLLRTAGGRRVALSAGEVTFQEGDVTLP